MTTERYCLRCPRGCLLQITEAADAITVTGNRCQLGIEFAIQEIRDPRRLFTSSVRVKGGKFPLVSVSTTQPVRRVDIPKWIELCRRAFVHAPIGPNVVVAKNPFGDAIDLVTTWYVEEEGYVANGR